MTCHVKVQFLWCQRALHRSDVFVYTVAKRSLVVLCDAYIVAKPYVLVVCACIAAKRYVVVLCNCA